MKILLVDDSKTMRTVQKRILNQLGFTEIFEASNGAEALAAVQQHAPHLVLLDWNMPTMNGIEFVKEFRSFNQITPVIMVTTEAEKVRVIEAIKAGVNNYVVKPFTPELLNERIQETLAARKAG